MQRWPDRWLWHEQHRMKWRLWGKRCRRRWRLHRRLQTDRWEHSFLSNMAWLLLRPFSWSLHLTNVFVFVICFWSGEGPAGAASWASERTDGQSDWAGESEVHRDVIAAGPSPVGFHSTSYEFRMKTKNICCSHNKDLFYTSFLAILIMYCIGLLFSTSTLSVLMGSFCWLKVFILKIAAKVCFSS